MTRHIDQFVPAMEPFIVWHGGFTLEDCERIVELGELAEFEKGRIGGAGGGPGSTDIDVRNTDIVWLQPNENTFWIFEKMNSLIAKINFDKFQMDLDRFDGFQYSKYSESHHYNWHIDTAVEPYPNGMFRKLSLSLMLTDPTDYEGGDFLLNLGGNADRPTKMRLEKGDLVVFYSHIPHKVEPVTKGIRTTLVTWALGPKMV